MLLLVFAGLFVLNQLDGLYYTLVALVATVSQHLRPVPGHPKYNKKHPTPLLAGPRRLDTGRRLQAKWAGDNSTDVGLGTGRWTLGAYITVPTAKAASSKGSKGSSGSASLTAAAKRSRSPEKSLKSWVDSLLARARSVGSPLPGDKQTDSAEGSEGDVLATVALPTAPAAKAAHKEGGGGTLLPQSLVSRYEHLPGGHPLVLVQLPMYNEEAHCEAIIERACCMEWPRDRLIVQVCDDSTRSDIKSRIDAKVAEMAAAGTACVVVRRAGNVGFKAGNLINAMEQLSGIPWEYVAVFDADFEMSPDFLYQTIWHMAEDKRVGFVQTRWAFNNADDNFLCRAQASSLTFHHKVEQHARSYTGAFFSFNGTGGVWRRAAMESTGGWDIHTLAEDADLSARAYLMGWKFLYLTWVTCGSVLPTRYGELKTQQYRWFSGPMVVLKRNLVQILSSSAVNIWDRMSCLYFFIRLMYIFALAVAGLACPIAALWVDRWRWELPDGLITIGDAPALAVTWVAKPLLLAVLLSKTVTGYFQAHAMWAGLVGSKESKGWTVTKKCASGGDQRQFSVQKPDTLELLIALYYLAVTLAACFCKVWVLAGITATMAGIFAFLSVGSQLF